MSSANIVEVVPVTLSPHPNADKLSLVYIEGYCCVVNTEDWKDRDRAAWVPPDNLVDTTLPEFSFLGENAKFNEKSENVGLAGKYAKVSAKKLRGVVSYGLLVPVSPIQPIGDDITESLGVVHYEPPARCDTRGEVIGGPPGVYPKYDVENFQKYSRRFFTDGEPVVITEKIHGGNARYVCVDGVIFCGSRTEWKREAEGNLWWKVLHSTPELKEFILKNEGVAVYGEVYGQVQDLKYGASPSQVWFAGFDLLRNGVWVDFAESQEMIRPYNVPWVPILETSFPFDTEKLTAMADRKTAVKTAPPNHIAEGIVVKPLIERYDYKYGRAQLKIVSPLYLCRKETEISNTYYQDV